MPFAFEVILTIVEMMGKLQQTCSHPLGRTPHLDVFF